MSAKLSKQLNKLNDIRPDREWQARSREILLSQISRGRVEKESGWFSFIETPAVRHFLFIITQPAALVAIVLIMLFGGSYLSVYAASQTKPGDALYIAKLISERTQFALTFNDTQKTKLSLSFAANRAEEITKIQAEDTPDKEAKVAALTADLKSELDEAQKRITKIALPAAKKSQPVAKVVAPVVSKTPASDKTGAATTLKSANLEKESVGVDYYDPRQAALQEIKDALAKKDYEATAATLKSLSLVIDEPAKLATTSAEKKQDVKVDGLEKGTSTVAE